MQEVDCSYGEGGGQLARTAVAAAALSGTPVRLVGIRAQRAKPGLAAQHLAAVRAVADLCGASVGYLALGATELEFNPGALRPGSYTWDVGTAGSITLVLQAALPLALQAPGSVHLRITGGTDVRAAPPLDYFTQVLLPLLARMGAKVGVRVMCRGYYPRGGGVVEVDVPAGQVLHPLRLETPGALQALTAYAHVANLPRHIVDRMCASAAQTLRGRHLQVDAHLLTREAAVGQGGGLTLVARMGHTVLGAAVTAERGVRAEELGAQAARALNRELDAGATVDVHAADQLLIYAALAGGISRFQARELSSHARTTLWVLERLLPLRHRDIRHGDLHELELHSAPEPGVVDTMPVSDGDE